jgi:hypothetical protein
MQMILSDFKQAMDPRAVQKVSSSALGRSIRRRSHHSSIGLSHPQLQAFQAILQENVSDERLFTHQEVIVEYLKQIIQESDWLLGDASIYDARDSTNESSIIETLLDLSNYKDDKLLTLSFVALNRIFTSTEELLTIASQSQIHIVPSSISLTQDLYKQLPKLRRLAGGKIEQSELEFVFFFSSSFYRMTLPQRVRLNYGQSDHEMLFGRLPCTSSGIFLQSLRRFILISRRSTKTSFCPLKLSA